MGVVVGSSVLGLELRMLGIRAKGGLVVGSRVLGLILGIRAKDAMW